MGIDRANAKIREAVVAGLFYPDSKAALAKAVDTALQLGPPAGGPAEAAAYKPARDDALAILSPHGGFSYSAEVQGRAWNACRGRNIRTVVVLGPWHGSHEGSVYLPESASFKTPLGNIAVDQGLCQELESCGTMFQSNDIPHLAEHSIELQLPFMKQLFPEAALVPILVSGNDPGIIMGLARALDLVLAPLLGHTLIVVSSNLSSSFDAELAARRSDELLEALALRDAKRLSCAAGLELSAGAGTLASLLGMQSLGSCGFSLLGRKDSIKARGDLVERIVHYAAGGWFPNGGL
jgi:AmmeMemoRadiSam system protein B